MITIFVSIVRTSSGTIIEVAYTYHFPNGYGATATKDCWTGHDFVPAWELTIFWKDSSHVYNVIDDLTATEVIEELSKIICYT